MRWISPWSHQKRMRLLRARMRKLRRRLLNRTPNEPTRPNRWTHQAGPQADAKLFEDSCAGIPSLALERSSYIVKDGRRLKCMRLRAPSDFRISKNLDEVMRFIYALRRQVFINRRFRMGSRRDPGLYLDFDHIDQIDLEGALVLSAELDRVRRIVGIKAELNDAGWNPQVRAILHSLGLYGVIEASRTSNAVPIGDMTEALRAAGLTVVPFVSSASVKGEKAKALQDALYELCEPAAAQRRPVYDGLVEAFTNAVEHAYEPDIEGDGLPLVRRWWAGALVDHRAGYLYLVVYDQGVGIPKTLVRRDFWSAIRVREHSDAGAIEGALEYGASRTDADGRGNGLWRMCELTNAFAQADVCFTSLKGDVLYVKGGRVERTTLRTRFCGTMIRWRAKIGPAE